MTMMQILHKVCEFTAICSKDDKIPLNMRPVPIKAVLNVLQFPRCPDSLSLCVYPPQHRRLMFEVSRSLLLLVTPFLLGFLGCKGIFSSAHARRIRKIWANDNWTRVVFSSEGRRRDEREEILWRQVRLVCHRVVVFAAHLEN